MICQHCGKNEATTHIRKIVNGETALYHLCGPCAGALGYKDVFSGFGLDLSKMFGSFLSDGQKGGPAATARCEKCGSSFEDIMKSGKIGCADCYSLHYNKLLPSLQRIHGKTVHEGKVSAGAGEEIKNERRITDLKALLSKAVEEQNFEHAAKLRDEIRSLEF
ncbi:MAG: UvrB/UvrC motif-containing protein [Oscillospiraceae bacterium]|nr:UvrB/UvrC motif-containing protein [Oscillospiraceae bacterium]